MARSYSKRSGGVAVPQLSAKSLSFETFQAAFSKHQAALVKGCLHRRALVGLAEVQRMYATHPQMVHKTFNLEGSVSNSPGDVRRDACRVFGRFSKSSSRSPWYASFIVQKNRAALRTFLQALPFEEPNFLDSSCHEARHSDAVWVFVGRNTKNSPLRGRPEHTDALQHSGTWHLQLRGSKVWKIRPTAELKRACPSLKSVGSIKVQCAPGDILCINTRLWWHQTYLPARCGLSMSVARDVRLGSKVDQKVECDMTNVEGHFATKPISKGTIIFTEDDAPDCQLPRSSTPNCELGELSNGKLALVAKRSIKKGDWFSIAPSEEEEETPPKKRQRS